ncbi:MAG: Co2+/Mg2+ efflux protein ApaG [Spirosomataceae bacterium]|jgi:ApaG protein
MEVAITNGIKVTVTSEYQPMYSEPLEFIYAFSYRIRIENNSENTVQLISRHWHIFDGIGEKYEVIGNGVVGFQPVIEPGQSHEYVSGCNFKAPIGKMSGTYLLEKQLDGEKLIVKIPEFVLMMPAILN